MLTVRVPAELRGMGFVARCILETWRECSSRGRVFIRCRIVDEPPGLPDGCYGVEVEGQMVSTRKFSGEWELSFLPSRIGIDYDA